MKIERLSREEFDRLAGLTRLPAKAKAMAAAVLVEGRTQVEVSEAWSVPKQSVNRNVAAINRVYNESAATTIDRVYKNAAVADGAMVRTSFELPMSLAVELGILAEAIQNCKDSALVDGAVTKARAGIRSAIRHLT